MGELKDLAGRLKADPRISKTRFNPLFLEDVGNILQNRGFAEARLFVWEHRNRGDLEEQVKSLLLILDELEKTPMIKENRSIGRYILKNKLQFLVEEKGAGK